MSFLYLQQCWLLDGQIVAPDFDDQLKTNVNLFRVLFSYLSDNQKYLNALEDDKSYQIIDSGAPFGAYELIDEN